MTPIHRRSFLASLFGLIAARTSAAPTRYTLDAEASSVGFRYSLNGLTQTGTMSVLQATIVVDPDRLSDAFVDVTLDVTSARTGFFVATDALKGPDVLDAARFPTIRFVSTTIRLAPDGRLSDGATIRGEVTIRDRTRPVTLTADVFRPAGTAPDDLRQLTVHLTGEVSRSAFGASGFAGLVDDIVALDITAVIRATA